MRAPPPPRRFRHEVESASSAKEQVLRELAEATSRVSRSSEEWRKLSKALAAQEADLDSERKRRWATTRLHGLPVVHSCFVVGDSPCSFVSSFVGSVTGRVLCACRCGGSAEAKAALQSVRAELSDTKAALQSVKAELADVKRDADSSTRAAKSAEHSVMSQDSRLQRATEEVSAAASDSLAGGEGGGGRGLAGD